MCEIRLAFIELPNLSSVPNLAGNILVLIQADYLS